MPTPAAPLVVVKCPRCGRFLAEITPPARVACCGIEIIVRPKDDKPQPETETRIVKG